MLSHGFSLTVDRPSFSFFLSFPLPLFFSITFSFSRLTRADKGAFPTSIVQAGGEAPARAAHALEDGDGFPALSSLSTRSPRAQPYPHFYFSSSHFQQAQGRLPGLGQSDFQAVHLARRYKSVRQRQQ
jgi:hypothetical protein